MEYFILSMSQIVSLPFLCVCVCSLSFLTYDDRVLHKSKWCCYRRWYTL